MIVVAAVLALLATGIWLIARDRDHVAADAIFVPRDSEADPGVIDIGSLPEVATGPASTEPAVPAETTAPAAPVVDFEFGSTPCPPADGATTQTQDFSAAFERCIVPGTRYAARVETNKGSFTIELNTELAPGTVNNFVALARHRFYENVICHRVVSGFVVQCGDPTGTGSGGPGYAFADEYPPPGAYQIGSVAMANAGPNTNGSQFFIITGRAGAALPPSYSLFGQVTDGFDVAVTTFDGLAGDGDGPPLEEIRILGVTITATPG